MYSMDDMMSTPLMYQDIGRMALQNPMGMPIGFGGIYGGGMYPPSYLGDVRMQPQLDHDKFQTMKQKEQESWSSFKKATLALGGLLLITCIGPLRKSITKAGGITKYMEKQYNSIKNWFKPKTPKPSMWEKFKNIFKKKPKTTTP